MEWYSASLCWWVCEQMRSALKSLVCSCSQPCWFCNCAAKDRRKTHLLDYTVSKLSIHLTTPLWVSSGQSCGPPPTVKNAQVQLTGQTGPHSASYVCDVGLQLIGPKTLICLANGTWSPPAPQCEGMKLSCKMFK